MLSLPIYFFTRYDFFQVLCGALLCVLIWSLGRQLFNTAVGAVAACAAALYGPLIFLTANTSGHDGCFSQYGGIGAAA